MLQPRIRSAQPLAQRSAPHRAADLCSLPPRPRRLSFPGKAVGVSVGGGAASPAAAAAAAPAKPAAKAAAGSDSDEELDLFGDSTPEEQAAAAERAKVVAAAKARSAEKALLSKSMIILDVKPWDDETDMALLEKHVRSIVKDGLLWGTSKLVPVGFGIKKLQITAVIEDNKVPSFDEIIEDHIVCDGENEWVQSCDIAVRVFLWRLRTPARVLTCARLFPPAGLQQAVEGGNRNGMIGGVMNHLTRALSWLLRVGCTRWASVLASLRCHQVCDSSGSSSRSPCATPSAGGSGSGAARARTRRQVPSRARSAQPATAVAAATPNA
jgi:elongation factor 1-beta